MDLLGQVVFGCEAGPPEELSNENAEPYLNLVEPRGVFGCVYKSYPMRWADQKSSPRLNRFKDSRFAFHPEIFLDIALFGHKPDKGFRFVGVELIANKDPVSFRVKADGLFDVFNEVHFGTGVADGRTKNLSCRYLEVGDECLRPMSNVFKFPSFLKTGFSRLGWMESLESLDTGHLIGTHDMVSLFV